MGESRGILSPGSFFYGQPAIASPKGAIFFVFIAYLSVFQGVIKRKKDKKLPLIFEKKWKFRQQKFAFIFNFFLLYLYSVSTTTTQHFCSMEKQSEYFKSEGGGQFFKLLSAYEVKVISLYDFNPIIERRRLSPTIIAQLKCVPCPAAEFERAEKEAIKLLDLPQYCPVA